MTDGKSEIRVVVSARVTQESANGWHRFCHEKGVSLSALIEVIGHRLAVENDPARDELRAEMTEQARALDIQRRARKKT